MDSLPSVPEEIEGVLHPDPFLILHSQKESIQVDVVYREEGLQLRLKRDNQYNYGKILKLGRDLLYFQLDPLMSPDSFSFSLLDKDGSSLDLIRKDPQIGAGLSLRTRKSPFLSPTVALEKTNSRAAKWFLRSLPR